MHVAEAPISSSSNTLPYIVGQMEVLRTLLQPDKESPSSDALKAIIGKLGYSTSLLS